MGNLPTYQINHYIYIYMPNDIYDQICLLGIHSHVWPLPSQINPVWDFVSILLYIYN